MRDPYAVQELFGAYLSLSSMPAPDEAQQVLAHATSTAASAAGQLALNSASKRQKSASSGAGQHPILQSAITVALAKALPNASAEGLERLAEIAAA